jgi:uncharacterized protein (DUF302 family)
MSQITRITIEHVKEMIKRHYGDVLNALEERLGTEESQRETMHLLLSEAPWEQILQRIEKDNGTSGFITFLRVDHGLLNERARKKNRAVTTYAVGNPLLAMEMTSKQPAVALYAPLRLAVYEEDENTTVIEYDRFASLVAQYNDEHIARIAQMVDQKLDALVDELRLLT